MGLMKDMVALMNGSLRVSQGPGGTYMADLKFDLEIIRPFRHELPSPHSEHDETKITNPYFPCSTNQLLAFSSSLGGFPIQFLVSNHSQFVQNLVQYCENWGMDVTFTNTNNGEVTIKDILHKFDRKEERMPLSPMPLPSTRACQNMIIIDDDFAILENVIQHRLENVLNSGVVYFTTPSNAARINEYILAEESRRSGSLGFKVLICTKPVGRRKFLAAVRGLLADYENTREKQKTANSDQKITLKKTSSQVPEIREKTDGLRSTRRGNKKEKLLSRHDMNISPPINVLIAEGELSFLSFFSISLPFTLESLLDRVIDWIFFPFVVR